MNTTFILRNKQFNKLSKIEKQEVINQVRKAYLEDNMKIDELISTFNTSLEPSSYSIQLIICPQSGQCL